MFVIIFMLTDISTIFDVQNVLLLADYYLPNAVAALDRLENQFVCLSVSQSVSLSHKTS